jgi:hypothetical protein
MLTDPGLDARLAKAPRLHKGSGPGGPHRYRYSGSLMAVAVRVDRYLIRPLVGR